MTNRWLALIRPKDGNWTNSAGAAIAAAVSLWGAWILFFKEILVPAVAPVNISLGLDVKKLKPAEQAGGDIPVLLSVSAKNSSGKTLRINKSFWVAHAIAINHSQRLDESEIISEINKEMKLQFENNMITGTASSRQSSDDTWSVVAFGPLFDTTEIRSGEEIKAQRLILVPAKNSEKDGKPLEILKVTVKIPSYAKRSRLAEEGLVRVMGGITYDSSNYVVVTFCQANRKWQNHNLRWWFDKFQLPQEKLADGFEEPASRNCPYPMTDEEQERIGAQVFTSVQEIPLGASDPTTSESSK
jgi:hypothetical protein